jgi:CRP/FNR family transcriptional regulator, anaerobic regulatory protein
MQNITYKNENQKAALVDLPLNIQTMKKLLLTYAFHFLEKEVREELENAGTLRMYKKGELLVIKGKPISNTFLILKGLVKAYREDAGSAEFVLYYLQEGQCFAVSVSADSKAEHKISIASFVAEELTYVLQLAYEDKDRMAKKFDSWYKYILSTAVAHYNAYTSLIDNIAFEKLDNRIEFFLLRLSNAKNKTTLKISHQEIANGLNASRESVSRLLKKMEEEGKISLGHNVIEIKNLSV